MLSTLRLKIKLVIAITAMVVAIVITLSTLYISQVVRQRIRQTSEDGRFVAWEIYQVARDPLQVDLSNARIDVDDPKQVEQAVEEVLQTDAGLNSLLDSVLGYSNPVYDAAITNPEGRALLHTLPSQIGQVLKPREEFSSVLNGGIWKQLKIVYGPPQVYDAALPTVAPGREQRVGLSLFPGWCTRPAKGQRQSGR